MIDLNSKIIKINDIVNEINNKISLYYNNQEEKINKVLDKLGLIIRQYDMDNEILGYFYTKNRKYGLAVNTNVLFSDWKKIFIKAFLIGTYIYYGINNISGKKYEKIIDIDFGLNKKADWYNFSLIFAISLLSKDNCYKQNLSKNSKKTTSCMRAQASFKANYVSFRSWMNCPKYI